MDIAVLNFGGQYCHLIARRIRSFGVSAEILSAETTASELKRINPRGIILSGGAASVYDKNAPMMDKNILSLDIPILGICYGHQMLAHTLGGKVVSGDHGEYGITELKIKNKSRLMKNFMFSVSVWMNHRDVVTALPDGYRIDASTADTRVAAFSNEAKKIYGMQFHPEVTHTKNGDAILENFVFNVCKAPRNYKPKTVDDIVSEAKEAIGNRKAIIALSGGIDSSAAAMLAGKAIGDNLVAVYVDTGLMRGSDAKFVKRLGLNLRIISAKDKFFRRLRGITDPEEKRKIIGKTFIEIFEDAAKREKAEILIQGTIYSDRIESGASRHAATIKSHHNVGGLPEKMKLELYEPLRELYKDEVREIAKKIGLDKEIIWKQPFPGPGFAVRVEEEVDEEKVKIIRKANEIVEEEIETFVKNVDERPWQYFAILTKSKATGIKGDARSYGYVVVIRIVESKEAMTANFTKLDWRILEKMSTRITNEIPKVTRVLYDITNKPPGCIEWE